MYGIELLVEEHKNILRFCASMRSMCCGLLGGSKVDTALIRECAAFGKNYADKHHHGKEEQVLFKKMTDKLGPVADKLIRNGMLVEHDLGRLHMSELLAAADRYDQDPSLSNALDIITNAAGYATLLGRHIGKEDEVVYTFAQRALSQEDKDWVDEETKVFEADEDKNQAREHFLGWLEDFTKRFPAQ